MSDYEFTVELQPRIVTFAVDVGGTAGDTLHNQLPGRTASDAHPQSAITGLTGALAALQAALDALDVRLDVFEALGSLATDLELATGLATILGGVTVDADTLSELKGLIELRATATALTSETNARVAADDLRIVTVTYSGSLATARPAAAAAVYWKNYPAEPTNIADGDLWYEPA